MQAGDLVSVVRRVVEEPMERLDGSPRHSLNQTRA
jgi:hypothetical protein